MSISGGSAHRSIRLPVVEYDVDGKPIVAYSDGTFKAIDNYGPVDHPSVDGRGTSSSSSRPGDVRLWELTEKALQRNELLTDGPPQPETGAAKDVGPTTSLTSSAASDSRRGAGGSPRYKRRAFDKQASDDSTLRSTTVSNASSSLLRRLRWRRSNSTKRRSESDAGGKTAGGSGRRRKRGSRSPSKRKSGGYSIDKPGRRHSDIRSTSNGRRTEVVAGDEKQTSNVYWQEMIDESRRRQLSDSPSSSTRGGGKKRKQKSSPATSNRSSRRSRSTSSRRSSSGGGGSNSNGGSRLGGLPKMSSENETRQNGPQTDDVMSTVLSITSSNRELVDVDEAVWTERMQRSERRNAPCTGRCSVGIILIIAGCLLVAVGIIRLLVCYWHEFGSSIWAGIPLLLCGFAYVIMRRQQQFTSHIKMTIFLVLGAITSLAVLAAAAVSLVLLVQLLGQVVIASPDMENIDSQELNSVNFSRYDSGKTVTGVTSATWSSVVLGFCSLILLAISLHAQTITVKTLDEYLDLVINDGIGDWPNLTSHRRAFRPVDQMTVGQTIVFVGFIEITLIDYLSGHDESAPHAWTMIWSGALVIGAGLISIFYDKMAHSRKLGIVSSTVEMCALLSCAITTVLTTLNLAKDAQKLQSQVDELHESPIISNLAAMICAEAIADCLSIVGIVFCIGILFRQFTRNCDCAGNVERGDKAARRGSTVGSVSDGRRSARNTMSTWRPSHETEMYVVGAGITVEQTSTGAVASSPDDR